MCTAIGRDILSLDHCRKGAAGLGDFFFNFAHFFKGRHGGAGQTLIIMVVIELLVVSVFALYVWRLQRWYVAQKQLNRRNAASSGGDSWSTSGTSGGSRTHSGGSSATDESGRSSIVGRRSSAMVPVGGSVSGSVSGGMGFVGSMIEEEEEEEEDEEEGSEEGGDRFDEFE